MTINGQDLTTHHEFPVNLQGILEPPVVTRALKREFLQDSSFTCSGTLEAKNILLPEKSLHCSRASASLV
jgi:hypothetical protein